MISIVFFIIIMIFIVYTSIYPQVSNGKEQFSSPNIFKGNVPGWDLLPQSLEMNPLSINSGDTSWGPGYGRPWGDTCWNERYRPSKCPYYWTGKCPFK